MLISIRPSKVTAKALRAGFPSHCPILTTGRVELASARKRRVPLPSRVEIVYRFEGWDAVERTEADVEERRRRQSGMGIR